MLLLVADPAMMQMLVAAMGVQAPVAPSVAAMAMPPAIPTPPTAVIDSTGQQLAVNDRVQVLHPLRMQTFVAATGVVAELNLQGGCSWVGAKKFACKVTFRGMCVVAACTLLLLACTCIALMVCSCWRLQCMSPIASARMCCFYLLLCVLTGW